MSWTHKETVERFSELLKESKKMMNKFYDDKGVFTNKEVTSEELIIATGIIKRMGNI